MAVECIIQTKMHIHLIYHKQIRKQNNFDKRFS